MIPGLRVGHATDPVGLTGVTVLLPDRPAVGGVDIRGWAVGIHGLEFLDPRHLVPTLDGIVLAGGSAFGLEAIWGVMQWLEERGTGFATSQTVIPHVAGAILYDLGVGDHRARPDRAMGHAAAAAARPGPVAEGNVGAGTGATVGKLRGAACAMKGGLGCATAALGDVAVGALVAVNAVGDVRDPETGRLIAGTRNAADGRLLIDTAAALAAGAPAPRFRPVNTTIGVVATTAALGKEEATRLAQLGMDGFAARAVPASSPVGRRRAVRALYRRRPRRPPRSRRRRGPRRLPRHRPGGDDGTSLPGLPSARDLAAGRGPMLRIPRPPRSIRSRPRAAGRAVRSQPDGPQRWRERARSSVRVPNPCVSMRAMSRRAKVIPFPRSPAPPSPAPAFTEVRRCRDQGEALVVRGLLESRGIGAVLRSHLAQSVHPFSVGDQGEVIVLVADRDAHRARRILPRP